MLNLPKFNQLATSKVERSTLTSDLHIARATIGVQTPRGSTAMFGYGTGLDASSATTRARFELYERLCFMASMHSEQALREVCDVQEDLSGWPQDRVRLGDFVYGALGPHGPFGGNGTAVHTNRHDCVINSKRELLERHLCAQFWYKQAFRPMRVPVPMWIETDSCLEIFLYGLTVRQLDSVFVLSALAQVDASFFAIGAALRPNHDEAVEHALGEAVMLFNDFDRGRRGPQKLTRSGRHVLLLRDASVNRARRAYFNELVEGCEPEQMPDAANHLSLDFQVNTVTFEPTSGIFAARSFSHHAMDPIAMASHAQSPTMPLC